MKKITLLLFISVVSIASCFAQVQKNTNWKNHVNNTFQGMTKARVPHGILLDFAMEFTDISAYNGALTDSTAIDMTVLGNIYKTLYMGRVTPDTLYFPEIKIYAQDWSEERLTYNQYKVSSSSNTVTGKNTMVVGGLYYKYSKLNEQALSNNKIIVSNNKYYDKYINGVWQNPYEEAEVIGFSPSLTTYNKLEFQVVLPENLLISNSKNTIQSIKLNPNDGGGYRTLTYDSPKSINYTQTGIYDWIFKITMTDSSILYTKSKIKIDNLTGKSSGATAVYEDDVYISGPGGSPFLPNGAVLRIDYAPAHNGELRRPFIIAEGFDTGVITSPEKDGGDSTLEDFIRKINTFNEAGNLSNLLDGNLQEYDLVYIDWLNGTANLKDNSEVLENVIDWVNTNKVGSEQNVLLGQSMGGVIGRYTLARMESESNPHDVRLFVSHDAPLQGSNTPLSTQFFSRHFYNVYVTAPIARGIGESLVPLGFSLAELGSDAINALGGNTTVDPYVSPESILTLQDTPAAMQLNYEWVGISENVYTSPHDNWQQEFDAMGYPSNSRNVAISNGNECGNDQGFNPGDLLLSVHDIDNPDVWGDLAHLLGTPAIGLAINDFGLVILGAVPGSSKYFYDFELRSTPNLGASDRNVYEGEISYEKRFLWLIPIKYTITQRSKDAPSSSLPYDYYAGGYFDTNNVIEDLPQQFPPISIINAQYGFIPVVSALDVRRNNDKPLPSDYLRSYGGGTIPTPDLNSDFDNFIVDYDPGAIVNNEHISFQTRNGNWLANELNQENDNFVDCSFLCDGSLSITGNENLCSSQNYNVQSGNALVSWDTNSSIINLSNSSTGQVVISPANSNSRGNVTITATISSPGCGSTTVSKNLYIGKPYANLPQAPNLCTNSFSNPYTLPASEGATSYRLKSNSPYLQINGQNEVTFTTAPIPFINFSSSSPGTYLVELFTTNGCGESRGAMYVISESCGLGGPGGFNVYPNPASSEVTIEANPEKLNRTYETQSLVLAPSTQLAKLFDFNGAFVKDIELDPYGTTKMDVSNLKEGMYFLKIQVREEEETYKIIVRR